MLSLGTEAGPWGHCPFTTRCGLVTGTQAAVIEETLAGSLVACLFLIPLDTLSTQIRMRLLGLLHSLLAGGERGMVPGYARASGSRGECGSVSGEGHARAMWE